MFTRILNALTGVLVESGHRLMKSHDPDIRLFANDPAALAYLRTRPRERGHPPILE